MARPVTHTEALRESLVDRALEVTSRSGVGSLTLRRLAESTGTSTSAVYALFGSRETLQREVLIRGFVEFSTAQEGVGESDNPVEDLLGLGAVYVGWGVENPRLYEAMFGGAVAGITSTDELTLAKDRSITPVTAAARRALACGAFAGGELSTVVASLWSQVHGLTLLLISESLPEGADPALAALAVIDGWRARA